MHRAILYRTLIVLGLCSFACAQPASTGNNPGATAAPHDRSVLFGDELRNAPDQYLYDVIQRLRPEWLRTHGATSVNAAMNGNTNPDPIRVYVGTVRIGGPEVLARLPITNADSLKFFTAGQAQARFGPGNTNGVIQVISAPPRP
jgi:hypothetical protein